MSEIDSEKDREFWLFHDVDEKDILVLRRFIDPEIDLTPLIGIDELIDKLFHIIKFDKK